MFKNLFDVIQMITIF